MVVTDVRYPVVRSHKVDSEHDTGHDRHCIVRVESPPIAT